MKNTDWVKGAVIYQVYPDSFARSPRFRADGRFEPWDAPETPHGFKGGNLKGAEEKLPYLAALGVTAVYFNPVFSSCANHRYHTYDYFSVDPVLGGTPALESFIKAAHRRGIKVILDGVFNHASRGFFQFNSLLENGAASPYRDWFKVESWPVKAYNHASGEKPNYHAWWGLPALPKFNTKNPEVRRFIMEVAAFWLKKGIDGWRLDVPHEINDDSFWREFRRVCKKINPGCYITGEIWGDARRWLAGDQFDAVMNYRLSAACIAYFAGEKLSLSHSYAGKALKPAGQRRFMRDIERLLASHPHRTSLLQMNMLSSHDTDRLADTYGGDAARVRQAAVFAYLFPGAVNLYYGEELGLRGKLDAGARRGMPWTKPALWDKDLLAFYRALGRLRSGSAVLRDGRFRFLEKFCDGSVLAFERRLGGRRVACFMNCSDAPARVADPALGNLRPLLASPGLAPGKGKGRPLGLPPRSFAVFG